jgi:DNA-binding response OmpR family regulator
MKSVLMIEDDPVVGDLVTSLLSREGGFQVICTRDGISGLAQFRRQTPDILILDLGLPHLSGLEILKKIRDDQQTGATPILVLTARNEEPDLVIALELGADDYVAKPVRPRELVARVRALLRRTQRVPHNAKPVTEGDLFLDPESLEATFRGQKLSLSALEFRLLHFLASNPGKVYPRERLLGEAWGKDRFVTERSVDTYMWRLRKKLQAAGGGEDIPLKTFRGGGYAFSFDKSLTQA